MRGPIRTPILLPFGNRNTPAEPNVQCLGPSSQACGAWSRLAYRASPHHACRSWPCQTIPRHACDDVHRQAFLASPAAPYLPHQTLIAPELA